MITQFGVLAYRKVEGGHEILLITSRDTRRWVIPRGNPIAGLSPHRSAAREAFEEAGLIGTVGESAIGAYEYQKRRKDGSFTPAEVQVFPLEFVEQKQDWPERAEREWRWLSPAEAAAAVDEPGLKSLILDFDPDSRG